MRCVGQLNGLNDKVETGRKSGCHHGKQFMENKYSDFNGGILYFILAPNRIRTSVRH